MAKTRCWCRSKSPHAIADAVERLIHDHALREKLVQGGLATAREYPREREWNEWESSSFGSSTKPRNPRRRCCRRETCKVRVADPTATVRPRRPFGRSA